MHEQFRVQQKYLDLINQVFEIEKKLTFINESNSIGRNLNRIKEMIEMNLFSSDYQDPIVGFVYHNPLGESYNETRTDCEASIAGANTDDLEIIEVIKPIIFYKYGTNKKIVQKAVVIVQSSKNSNE